MGTDLQNKRRSRINREEVEMTEKIGKKVLKDKEETKETGRMTEEIIRNSEKVLDILLR